MFLNVSLENSDHRVSCYNGHANTHTNHYGDTGVYSDPSDKRMKYYTYDKIIGPHHVRVDVSSKYSEP
jgi:hypothetical protein